MSVSAPMRRFLLASKELAVCAVRFMVFHRDHDKAQPGVFAPGDEHTYAEYDRYFQGDGSGDFSKTDVTSGHGELRNTPSFGIGRFAFKPSEILHITCGSFRVAWGYPNALQFISYPKSDPKDESDLELAPTRFSDIGQIDFTSPKRRWYKLNDRLPPTVIPPDQLP